MEQIIIVAFWSGVAAAKSFLRRCNSFCAIRFYKLLMTGCCVGRRRGGEDCLHNAERQTRGWKDCRLRKTEGGGKRECSGIGWHWTFWKSNEQVEQLLAELVLPPCFEPSAGGAPFVSVLTNPWFMEAWRRGALHSERWIASDYYFQSGELAEFQLKQISIPSRHQHQHSCRNSIPETWDGPTCKYFSTQGFELGSISSSTLKINYLC